MPQESFCHLCCLDKLPELNLRTLSSLGLQSLMFLFGLVYFCLFVFLILIFVFSMAIRVTPIITLFNGQPKI